MVEGGGRGGGGGRKNGGSTASIDSESDFTESMQKVMRRGKNSFEGGGGGGRKRGLLLPTVVDSDSDISTSMQHNNGGGGGGALHYQQLVEQAFVAMNTKGDLRRDTKFLERFVHGMKYSDIRDLQIVPVQKRLERFQDIRKSSRNKLALHCCHVVKKYLEEEMTSFPEKEHDNHNHNNEGGGGCMINDCSIRSSRSCRSNASIGSTATTNEMFAKQVFLQARVVVASEGNRFSKAYTLIQDHITGKKEKKEMDTDKIDFVDDDHDRHYQKGCGKLVIAWCLYSIGKCDGCRILLCGRNSIYDPMLDVKNILLSNKSTIHKHIIWNCTKKIAKEISAEMQDYSMVYWKQEEKQEKEKQKGMLRRRKMMMMKSQKSCYF